MAEYWDVVYRAVADWSDLRDETRKARAWLAELSDAARAEGDAETGAALKAAAAHRADAAAIDAERRALDSLADAARRAAVWTEFGGRNDMPQHLADLSQEKNWKDLINRADWLGFSSPQAAYSWRQRELEQGYLMNRAHFGATSAGTGYTTADQYLAFLQKERTGIAGQNETLLARAAVYKSNAEAYLAYANALKGHVGTLGTLSEGNLSSAQAYEAALAGLPPQVTTRLALDDSGFIAKLAADRAMLTDFSRTYTTRDIITASYGMGAVPLDRPRPAATTGESAVSFGGPWQEQAAAVLALVAELSRQRIEIPVDFKVDAAALAGIRRIPGAATETVHLQPEGGAVGVGPGPPGSGLSAAERAASAAGLLELAVAADKLAASDRRMQAESLSAAAGLLDEMAAAGQAAQAWQDLTDAELASAAAAHEAGTEEAAVSAKTMAATGLLAKAAELVMTRQLGSVSMLQRTLKVGYAEAASLMDQLSALSIVGPPQGGQPREVLVPAGDEQALKAVAQAEAQVGEDAAKSAAEVKALTEAMKAEDAAAAELIKLHLKGKLSLPLPAAAAGGGGGGAGKPPAPPVPAGAAPDPGDAHAWDDLAAAEAAAGGAAEAAAAKMAILDAVAAGDADAAGKFAYAYQVLTASEKDAGDGAARAAGNTRTLGQAMGAAAAYLQQTARGWGIFNAQLLVFSGLMGAVSLWHLLFDALLEIIIVLVTAIGTLVAGIGAFLLVATLAQDTLGRIKDRMVAVNTAATATGQAIYPLANGFNALAKSVRPEVFQLFGDALTLASGKMGVVGQLGIATGRVLDTLGARFVVDLQAASGAINKFLASGAQNLKGLGEVFANIGHILSSLIIVAERTHIAEDLLAVVAAVTSLLARLSDLIRTPVGGWIATILIGFHGIWIWGGLAATSVLGLVRSLALMAGGTSQAESALGGLAANASGMARFRAIISDIGAGFAALPGRIAGTRTSLKDVAALSGESVASLSSLQATAERAGTSIADMVKGPAVRDVAEFGKGVDAAGMDLLNLAAYANTSRAGLGQLAVKMGSTSEEAKAASAGMGSLAAGMAGASEKAGLFSGLMGTLAATMADPLTWILLAVAALTAFSVAVFRANDNTQLWIKSMDQQLTKASLYTVIGQTVSDLAAATQKLAAAQAGGVGNAKELTAAQSDLSGKLGAELVHVGDVSKAYGVSMPLALGLLNTAGVKTSTLFTNQSKVWATAMQQVAGLVTGYRAMGQGLTQLQGDVSVQLVMGSDQLKQMQALNQAWDQWLTTVQSGPTTMVKYQQSVQTLGTDLGKTGASLGGLNAQSLTARATFNQMVPEMGQVLDAVRQYSAVLQNGADGSALLVRATKDVIVSSGLLGTSNQQVRNSLIAVAEQADPSVSTWQKLTHWVGKQGAAQAAADLDKVMTQLQTPVSNLAADAAKLTTTLQQDLDPAMANAEFNALGGQRAFSTFATDLQKLGPNAQPTIAAAGQVANILLAIDKNSSTAHDQFVAWAESMGYAAPQAEKLWNSAKKLSSTAYKMQIEDNITVEQNKISLLKQQISQTTDPAKKHKLQLELQVDESKLTAFEGDLKKAGLPASQLRTQLAGSATAAGDLSKSGLWGQIRDKIQELFSFAQAHPITTTIFGGLNFIPGFTSAMDTAGHAVTNFFTKTIPHAAGDMVNWFTQSLPHAWSTAYTGFQRDFAGPMTSWFTKSLPHAWDDVSGAVSRGWGTAYSGFQRDFAGPLTTWFTVSLPHAWGNVSSAVSTGWGTAYNGFQRDFAGPLTAWFTKSLPHAWNNVSSAVSTGWGTAYNGFQRDFAGPITYWATKLFPKSIVGQALSTAWGTAWNGFNRDFAGPMTAWFTQSLPRAVGTVGTAFSTAWGTAWNGFNRDVGGPLASFFTSSVPNFFDGVGRAWNRLWSAGWSDFVRDVWNPFSGFFTRTVQDWFDGVGRAWNRLWSAGWADFVRDVWNPFSSFFTKTVQDWLDNAGRAWNRLWSGGWADFVRDVWDPFSGFFTKTVPGWFGGTGTSWGKLWSKGWSDFVREVWNPLSGFFAKTVPGFFDGVGREWNRLWSTGWSDFSRNILQPMERWFTTSLPTAIKNAFRDAVNWVIANIVNGAINIINAVTHPFGVPKITGVGPLGGGAAKAASGGVMPARMAAGSVPGTGDADGTHIIAMGGEYMLRKPARMALEAAYGRGFMNHLNQADSWLAAGSRGSPESQQRHPGRNYAAGGPVQPMAAGGTYQDPLRAVRLLTPERIDMGVDYNGFGPLYAVGPGTIQRTAGPGWPGGVFIEERLSSGSESGRYIYYAEDIRPSVGAGQTVDSNTVIGQLFGGPSGIEIGWGVPGSDSTLAAAFHQQSPKGDPGSRSTAYGASMNAFLVSLGAPSGRLQGTISGNVAGGYMPPGGFGGLGSGIVGVIEGLLNSGGSALSSAVSAISRFVKGGAAEAVKLAQQGARFLFDGAWDHTITPLVNQVPAGNWEGSAARLMPAAIKKGVDHFLGAKDSAAQATAASASSSPGMIGPVSGPADAGPAQAEAYAQSRLSAYGWGPGQFSPLQSLWNRESGWNRFAQNPSSGAYGIPQALPPSKLPPAGRSGGGSHASPQIDWGLSYIKGTPGYGSPSAAWAHELAHNWYPFGGIIGEYAAAGEVPAMAPAMASGGSVYRFPVPSRLHAYDVTDKGFRLAWDAVRGPAGQKPTGYGVETYQLNSKVVDKFTARMTNTAEYGFGGKGLHPDWQYRTTVRPEGAPQAPLGQASMMTRLHKAKAPAPGKPPPKPPPGPVNAPEWDATSVALHDAAYGEMSAFWNLMGMKLPKQATRSQHTALSAWDRALEAQQLKTVGIGRKPPGAYAVIEARRANPKTITAGQWNTFFSDLGREISEEAGPGIKGGTNPPGTPANSGWVPWHYFRGQWQALRTAMLGMQSKGQQARGVWSNLYGPSHLPSTPGPPRPPAATPVQPGGPGHLLDLRPMIIGGPAAPVTGARPDAGFASGGTIGLQQVAAMFAGAMPATFMVPSAGPGGVSDALLRQLSGGGQGKGPSEPPRRLSQAGAAHRAAFNVEQMTINNPVSEQPSMSIARASNRLAFLAGRGES